MSPHYPLVARRAAHRCEYCHAPEVAFNVAFEIDHIQPVGQGGGETDLNLALGCRSCNVYKSDATTAADPVTREVVRLFNPRIDDWIEHFHAEADNVITGISPMGRATIERLRINSAEQIRARRHWRQLGLFP